MQGSRSLATLVIVSVMEEQRSSSVDVRLLNLSVSKETGLQMLSFVCGTSYYKEHYLILYLILPFPPYFPFLSYFLFINFFFVWRFGQAASRRGQFRSRLFCSPLMRLCFFFRQTIKLKFAYIFSLCISLINLCRIIRLYP